MSKNKELHTVGEALVTKTLVYTVKFIRQGTIYSTGDSFCEVEAAMIRKAREERNNPTRLPMRLTEYFVVVEYN